MDSTCWLWMGCLGHNGYGRLRHDGKVALAHRVAYEIFVGEFDKTKFICHKCDNPRCVNPAHLFCGTHQDNMDDMHQKGRWTSPNYGQHLKLTASMARIIKADPRNNVQIAKDWEVSRYTISNIKNGRTWKYA